MSTRSVSSRPGRLFLRRQTKTPLPGATPPLVSFTTHEETRSGYGLGIPRATARELSSISMQGISRSKATAVVDTRGRSASTPAAATIRTIRAEPPKAKRRTEALRGASALKHSNALPENHPFRRAGSPCGPRSSWAAAAAADGSDDQTGRCERQRGSIGECAATYRVFLPALPACLVSSRFNPRRRSGPLISQAVIERQSHVVIALTNR